MGSIDVSAFLPRTLDKVNRLLDLLGEFERHPLTRGKLALHGGTAINLFMLDVPRLSVDIDVSYVGALGRDEMLADRPGVECGVRESAEALGYRVLPGRGGHAGSSFMLNYSGRWGADHVKVDLIFMNRSPVLPLVSRETGLRPGMAVRTFDDAELAAGKVKAFFDRVKVRDIYDVANLSAVYGEASAADAATFHKVALFYASLSATFPFGFESRPARFSGLEREVAEQLVPMLRESDGAAGLAELIRTADAFVQTWVLPRSASECAYLERFASGSYEPDLLFDDAGIAAAAAASPEALWKLQNLREMPRASQDSGLSFADGQAG